MSISVGGIDLTSAIINLEYEMNRTQRILEWLLTHNPNIVRPSPMAANEIDAEALAALQKKYPAAGIAKK